jgi:ribosomal protein S20
MERHRSTIKRAKQDKVKRLRHRRVKSEVRDAIKQAKKSKKAEDLRKGYSVIDKAGKKGVLHKKTASRKKSRLALFVKSPTGKISAKKAPAKKASAKKASAKKVSAKKASVKKAPAKKAPAKKAPAKKASAKKASAKKASAKKAPAKKKTA